MPSLKYLFVGFLLIHLVLSANAQGPTFLRGYVTDTQGAKVNYATVVLKGANSSAIFATCITDAKGEFLLELPVNSARQEAYILEVHHLLYKSYLSDSIQAQALPQKEFHISLVEKTNSLTTVTIEGRKPIMERNGNALKFNISGQEHLKGRNLEDIMKNLPGVSLSPESVLQVFGRGGVAVFLNDDLQPLNPEQVQTYLSSMDYSIIESIEVIPSGSAETDATFSSIIRIRTKTKLSNLYSSNTLRYEQAIKPGFYYSNFTSVPINNSTFNILASYSNTNMFEFNKYERTSKSLHYTQETANRIHPELIAVEPTLRHTFQDKSSLIVYGKIGIINEGIKTTGNSTLDGSGYLQNLNTTENHSDKITAGLNYSMPLAAKEAANGKLSFAYDYSHNNMPANYTNTSSLASSNSAEPASFFAINTKQEGFLQLHIAKADYNYNAENEKTNFKLGSKVTIVNYKNNFEIEPILNSSWVPDSLDFRQYRYQERTYAAYASVTLKPFKQFDATLGLRSEHSSLENDFDTKPHTLDTSYFQLFPSVNLGYTFKNGNLLGYNLTRRINRPNFNQLNPTLFLTDPYTYLRGNETLLPELTTLNEIFFILNKNSVFSVSYTYVNRFIAQFPFQRKAFLELSPQNFEYRSTWTLYGSNQTNITPWWQLNSDASLYSTFLKFRDVKRQAASYQFSLRNNLTLPSALHANIDFQYEGPGMSGIFEQKRFYVLTAGLRRSFLKEKLTIGISAKDILYTTKIRNSFNSEAENIQLTQRFNSRLLSVSVNYVFNKPKGQRINKPIDEELQRL